MHIHEKQWGSEGKPLREARYAMVLAHGRGADARDILTLALELRVDNFALLAPQATLNTWYPFSFMAPVERNEPSLSSALQLLDAIVEEVLKAGVSTERIYLLGFSQGACLTAEYAARHAQRWGGIFLLSGGLIGDRIHPGNYQGDFDATPVFLGCSDVDPHIPLSRVEETAIILANMGAEVTKRIYPNAPHAVLDDEIRTINNLLP
jgi:phospholipase/carboxylesterase